MQNTTHTAGELKPRKPLLAALMSLILPGFGQLYNGQANKGILLFIGFILASLALPAIAAMYLPSALILPMVLIAGLLIPLTLWLYSIVQAWRRAKHTKAYQLAFWQQPAAYIGGFLLAMITLAGATYYVHNKLIRSFTIPSASMEPSVLRGDLLFADMRYNCPGCKYRAQRGDVAIFVYPNNRSQYFIKRIIGLPGDRVRISEQTVYVNDQQLTHQQTAESEVNTVTERIDTKQYRVKWDSNDTKEMAEITVPDGSVFVMGDNRSATKDSREFGTVPLMDVVGKARQIWFSKGADGVRWERFGKVVE